MDRTTLTIHRKSFLVSAGGLLFFVLLLVCSQISNQISSALWYAGTFFLAIMGILLHLKRINKMDILFLLTWGVTSLLCYRTGNMSLFGRLSIAVDLCITWVFLDKRCSSRMALAAFYMNVALVLLKYAMGGITTQIYLASSTNFVSVYLLCPLCIYYSIAERKREKITLLPAFVCWVTCVLSRGRGGILTASILLAGIYWVNYRKKIRTMNKYFKFFVRVIVVLVISMTIIALISNFTYLSTRFAFLEYFNERGFESKSRMAVWTEYFTAAVKNGRNLFLGVPAGEVVTLTELRNNPHNSFLNIHMDNGLIMVLFIIWIIIRGVRYGISNQKWIYLFCLGTMVIRWSTDNVFWGTQVTPAVMFLLFFPNDPGENKWIAMLRKRKLITYVKQ